MKYCLAQRLCAGFYFHHVDQQTITEAILYVYALVEHRIGKKIFELTIVRRCLRSHDRQVKADEDFGQDAY